MLNRDFTKTNSDYFKKNVVAVSIFSAFLVLGLLVIAIFGFNGNFEMKGYYEFSVNVTESTDYYKYGKVIEKTVDDFGGDFDNLLEVGEGDNTQLVVRYLKPLSQEKQDKIEEKLVEKLEISVDDINEHYYVKPVAKSADYIFTAMAILIIVALSSVFAYFRHNGACAITVILACALGTLSFLSISSILRLSVGLSYFAMLLILNVMLIYFALELFENMHNERWLGNRDFEQALNSAVKLSKTRQLFISIAVEAIGLLLVLFATSTLKYVAINVMFMAVIMLTFAWYVIPFIWSVFITKCRIKEYKVKATEVEDIKEENE